MPVLRRFLPPSSVEETFACFVVSDSGGQRLAYVYFKDKPGRRSAAKLLTRTGAAAPVAVVRIGGVCARSSDMSGESELNRKWPKSLLTEYL